MTERPAPATGTPPQAPPPRAILLVAFALSGAAALVYEVVWTRALSLVIGSSTYALSTMLAAFMGGLALGGWLGGKWADASPAPWRLFGFCELGIGVAGVASVPLFYSLPVAYLAIYRAFHGYPTLFFLFQITLCGVVMIVPTALMGATFPLVSRSLTGTLGELGTRVGAAYSWNTLGAVVGSLLGGFLLIPQFGLRGSVMVAGTVNLAVGLLLALWGGAKRRPALLLALLFPVSVALAFQTNGSLGLRNFYSAHRYLGAASHTELFGRDADAPVFLSMEENPEGTVSAYRASGGELLLQVAGRIEGTGNRDMTNALLLAYLPIAYSPEAKSALVIGLGTGVTLNAMKGQVPQVNLAEINPGVIRAVQRYGLSGLLSGVGVLRGDARNLLARNLERYDIITSEPSYPTDASVGNLFTAEYFELAAERLNTGGVYCLWLPHHMMEDKDVALVVGTFRRTFPTVAVWSVPESLDLLVVGTRAGDLRADAEVLQAVRLLAPTPRELVFHRCGDGLGASAAEPGEGGLINTDDRPLLEFRIVRNLLSGEIEHVDPRGCP